MLHAKAVTAEGRRPEGPAEYPAQCTSVSEDGQTFNVALDDHVVGTEREWAVPADKLWHWAVSASQQPSRVRGEGVGMQVGDRCVVAVNPATNALQAVQVVVRHTGKVASRPSAAVGQIEPDGPHRAVVGAKVFLKISEVAGARQLPAVGEPVEFQLALNPERADRLWAAEVVTLAPASLAGVDPSRPAPSPTSPSLKPSAADAAPPPADRLPPVSARPDAALAPAPLSPRGAHRHRVYVGRLPPTAGWRELHELCPPDGPEPVHVQVPTDERGRPRGFGVLEYRSGEHAAAALRILGRAEIGGARLRVMDDAAVIDARRATAAAARLYIAYERTVPYGEIVTHVRQCEGVGEVAHFPDHALVQCASANAAAAATAQLHRTQVGGLPIWVRQDCDVEGGGGRQEDASNAVAMIGQAPPRSGRDPAEIRPRPRCARRSERSFARAVLSARLLRVITSRVDASLVPNMYQSTFGERLEMSAYGSTLRDVVSSIDELEQETQGSRLWVFPKHRRDEPEHLRSPPLDRDDRRRHERGARGSSRGERGGAPPPPKRPRSGKSGGPPPPPRRGSPKRR